jgi:excisionase family DNA binding protein
MADQLNSWKELAHYLGCSVRTVQRWEEERGLPVHRLPGRRGAVFAVREEVDRWRLGQPVLSSPAPEPHATGRWRAIVLTGALALATASVGWMAFASRGPTVVTSFALQSNTLTALDAAGQPAWTHRFDVPTRHADLAWRPEVGPWIQHVDLDGDGSSEVLAMVDQDGDTLLAFDEDGSLRWRYRPSVPLDFTGRQSSLPLVFLDYELVPGYGVWVSVSDPLWWPSAIQQIAMDGSVTTRFHQPGNIRVLRAFTERNRVLVAIAGVNNEFKSAAVAILDPAVPGSAPTAPGSEFACRGCAGGAALRYVLLGPSPLNRVVARPYNVATQLLVGHNLVASTYEDEKASVLFTLTRDLEVRAAEPSDGYWEAISRHAPLSGDHHVDIREWTSSGWRSSRLPLTTRHPSRISTASRSH